VVTPTYNRAATLPILAASLEKQGVDLEWVVVDDGSDDETTDVMADLAEEMSVPVRLIRIRHGGKHVALNHGVPAARGEMLALIDSDDELLPGGLARLLTHWERIPVEKREGYVGVSARCLDDAGDMIGNTFPGPEAVDCPWQEAVYVHHAEGDRIGILRADVLREHPFPEPTGHAYVVEAMVWRQIGKRYLTRYVDDPVLASHRGGSDRMSRRPFVDTAAAARDYCELLLSQDLAWFRHAPAQFLRLAVQYARASLHERVSLPRQAARLPGPARALWAGALPVAVALWLRDRRQLSRSG
jgi:glycosyltransferase involved in cell wall biosynthesis